MSALSARTHIPGIPLPELDAPRAGHHSICFGGFQW